MHCTPNDHNSYELKLLYDVNGIDDDKLINSIMFHTEG